MSGSWVWLTVDGEPWLFNLERMAVITPVIAKNGRPCGSLTYASAGSDADGRSVRETPDQIAALLGVSLTGGAKAAPDEDAEEREMLRGALRDALFFLGVMRRVLRSDGTCWINMAGEAERLMERIDRALVSFRPERDKGAAR